MSAHTDALKVVKDNTFGTFEEMEEVSTKTPWGFYRSGCKNIHMDEFVKRPYQFRKTISLHILGGEGKDAKAVIRVIQKAVNECSRLLILEHNPDHKDWRRNKHVTTDKLEQIERLFNRQKLKFKKIVIANGRNLLYVVSTIKHFDWNDINHNYIKTSAKTHRAGYSGRVKKEIFSHTSEDYRRVDKLLDDEMVDFLNVANLPLYSVMGGMMILDALPQLDPPTLYLMDCSFKTALYGCVVINKIIECSTLEQFDSFVVTGISEQSLTDKINSMWSVDSFNQCLSEEKYWRESRYGNHWRHILKVGKWRESYTRVRNILIEKLHSIQPASLRDFKIYEDVMCLYTSTISEKHLPRNKKHIIISAEHKQFSKNCLEYYNGKLSPIGVSGKERDTPRIILRDPVITLSALNLHLSKCIAEATS